MFKNRIAYWAEARGLKHKHLAKECGVSAQTFSRWVRNITQPDLIQSYELSIKLGVKMEDLIEEED